MAVLRPLLRAPPRLVATSSLASNTQTLRYPFTHRPSVSQLFTPQKASLTRLQSQWGGPPRLPPQYNRFNRSQRLYGAWNSSPVFRAVIGTLVVGGGIFYVSNLEQVPVSGRRRFNCVSPQTEAAVADSQLNAILNQYRGKILPSNHPQTILVRRVLDRLIPAMGTWADPETKWELRVIDEPNIKNAFVIPGGKVFVFNGILPICKDEDGVAAVLGHEIAHNVAHHVAERMSKMGFLLGAAFLLAYTLDISGLSAQFVVQLALENPNNRTQESEADHIGLLIMAAACYDPASAIGLWQRMQQAEKHAPPQFLSTHPSSANRVKAIEQWVPEAEEKRNESGCGFMTEMSDRFRESFVNTEEDVPFLR